jgi:hypothetical protein
VLTPRRSGYPPRRWSALHVHELERDAELAAFDEFDHGLEVVDLLAGDAEFFALDAGLNLEFAVLDEADDLLGQFLLDAILNLDLALEAAERGALVLAPLERLDVDAPLVRGGLASSATILIFFSLRSTVISTGEPRKSKRPAIALLALLIALSSSEKLNRETISKLGMARG